jgi:hypothetical protein
MDTMEKLVDITCASSKIDNVFRKLVCSVILPFSFPKNLLELDFLPQDSLNRGAKE